jgi:hypothetical protein
LRRRLGGPIRLSVPTSCRSEAVEDWLLTSVERGDRRHEHVRLGWLVVVRARHERELMRLRNERLRRQLEGRSVAVASRPPLLLLRDIWPLLMLSRVGWTGTASLLLVG